VSAGTVVITDDKAQQALTGQTAAQAVAAVNNNVGVTNAGSISKDWNGQQLNSQVTANAQIVAAFGQQAATDIGKYADTQRDKLNVQAESLDKTDPEQAAALRAEAATWDEKGSNRVAMHTAAGLLGGGLGGAAGALASAEAMTTISDAIKGMGLPDSVSSGLAQIAATALGAAVGGGSGAAAALSVDANNRQLDKKEVDKLRELMQGKSPEEQQRLVDAACAKIRCADGMSDTNPAKADAVTSQQRGQNYVNEQNTLTSTGLFTYGALATAGDAASSVADSVSRQPIGRLASLAAGQAIDLGYGIVNLGIQVLSHGPTAIPQSPPDFPGDSNGPTGSAEAVVTATLPLYLCAPPVCLMTPPIVTGTSGAKWTNLTFSSGQDTGSSSGPDNGANSAGKSPGQLTGTPTRIPATADASEIRSLTRENQSAEILANNGFKVEQNPSVIGPKNPDYRINGDVFDNYAPASGNVRNIASNIEEKVIAGQTNNVVVNLSDSSATPIALREQLKNYPISGLEQVIIIDKSGNFTIVKLKGK
jgi:filamentous hemagglutinin